MLLWYIFYFLVKLLGRPTISFLTTSGQRERRNNAASLNLLKLSSLTIGVLLGSPFAVYVAGATKLFILIVSQNFFWQLKSRLSTKSLHYYWRTSSTESTKARGLALYAMPDPTLKNEFSTNGLIGSNLPSTVVQSFLNIALCVGSCLWFVHAHFG